jgi:hypothetical protein
MASSFPFLFPLLRNGLQREEAGKREVEEKWNTGIEHLSFSKYRSTRMERVKNDLTCELKLQETAKRHSLLSRRLFISGMNKGDRKL